MDPPLDGSVKGIESTVGALFGHGEDRGHQRHRQRDREGVRRAGKRMGEIIRLEASL